MSKKDIDVVISYPSHNRRAYTELTLPQVINEAKNSKHRCIIYAGDDNSTDGTWEYITEVEGIDIKEQKDVGNSIWQLNKAFELAKDLGAKYVIAGANDILWADKHIEALVLLMEEYPDACSMMIEEVFDMPFIKEELVEVKRVDFTSSLGIHRADLYPHNMAANKRFFGFANYQNKLLKQGYNCYKVWGMGNTNLDGSAWSRQEEYYIEGYARKGLVGNEKAVLKSERDA